MMGTPTTSIVVEELLNARRDHVHPRRDHRRLPRDRASASGRGRSAAASAGGVGPILGGGEATAPTADFEVVLALVDASACGRADDPRRARS